MSSLFLKCSCVGSFCFSLLLGASLSGEELNLQIKRGEELFTHQWQAKDALSPQGDGLGPLHNATSCVECHNQGGKGGAGPNDKNVEILAVAPVAAKKRNAVRENLLKIHNGFSRSSNLVLHKRSTFDDYDIFRLRTLGVRLPRRLDPEEKHELQDQTNLQLSSHPKPRNFEVRGISFQVSQRNTPALFGLALIDEIPTNDIIAEARQQAASLSDVKGRTAFPNPSPRVSNLISLAINPFAQDEPRVGRFGWRGQTATLEEFVRGACANELGLEVKNNSQPMNPLGPSYRAPGVDLTDAQCDELVAYVRSLPRPVQVMPDHPKAVDDVILGERTFREIGCAECHVPKMGEVDGLYSDLLLHDMGREFSDLAPVNSSASQGVSYYGGDTQVLTAISPTDRQSWRTPPLWGVRDSAPYMHDGRAKTLREAIQLHGGEARRARTQFVSLSEPMQARIIEFLQTLAAPQDDRGRL